LRAAIATNDALGLRGYTGALVVRHGWMLLHEGDLAGAETTYERALEDARRLRNAPVMFLALTGLAVLHVRNGRDGEAAAAATEGLGIHLAGGPRRFRNRVDQRNDLLTGAATCCTVLAVLAAGAGEAARATRLLGHAARLRGEARAAPPPFLQGDLDGAEAAARAVLGDHGFTEAFELGRQGELDAEVGGDRAASSASPAR
jgi:hypothetical protein